MVDAGLGFEAYHRADVQAADAGMAVVGGFSAVAADDFIEAAHEFAHRFGIDGGILHERQGLGVAMHTHQQTEAVLADVPYAGLGGAVDETEAGVTQPAALQILLQRFHFGVQLGFGFAVKFDRQDGAGILAVGRVGLDDRHRIAQP